LDTIPGVGRRTARALLAELGIDNSADYLYFSYVTLTTVDYGDFVARVTLGRMLSVTEALTGQAYLMTVAALLVSNFRSRRQARAE
jgi:voltage-gated potassium channel Kch